MTALQDATQQALQRIKQAGILGLVGRGCVIVSHFSKHVKLFPYRLEYEEKYRRRDDQEWYGFGVYFVMQTDPQTPYYDEVFLSYPNGELALGRKSKAPGSPRLLYIERERYFIETQMLAAVIDGIDAIGPRWSINNLPKFRTIAYQLLELSDHEPLFDLTGT